MISSALTLFQRLKSVAPGRDFLMRRIGPDKWGILEAR